MEDVIQVDYITLLLSVGQWMGSLYCCSYGNALTSGLAFHPHKLEKASRYRLRLTAYLDNQEGYTEWEIITNIPPYGGHCKAKPTSGYVEDKFEISCFDWVDEGLATIKRPDIKLGDAPATSIDTSGLAFHPHKLEKASRYRLRLTAYLDNQEGYVEDKFEISCFDWVDEGLATIKRPDIKIGDAPATSSGLTYEFRSRIHAMKHLLKPLLLRDIDLPPVSSKKRKATVKEFDPKPVPTIFRTTQDYQKNILKLFDDNNTASHESDVFYYGPDSYTPPSKLRMGAPPSFHVYIDVRIYDALGDFATETIVVQVMKKPDPEGIRYDELLNLTMGESSDLNAMVGWGNTLTAMQYISSISSEINFDIPDECLNMTQNADVTNITTNATSCANSTDTSKKKKEIRFSMLETMKNISNRVQTPGAAQQAAIAIRDTTDKTDEVTLDSRKLAVNSLDTVTEKMMSITSSSDQDISAAKDLVLGLGNILKSGSQQYSNSKSTFAEPQNDGDTPPGEMEAEKGETYKEEERAAVSSVTNHALEVAHKAAMLSIADRLVGQEQVFLGSDTLLIQAMRSTPLQMANQSFNTNSGTFSLPKLDSLPTTEEGYLNVEVTEMTDNLFAWDDTADNVTSSVLGLAFTDAMGEGLPVSDTTSLYEITFNSFEDIEVVVAEFRTEYEEELSYQNITAEEANTSMSLIIRAIDPRVVYNAYIKFEDHPSIDDYDLMTPIPHELNLTEAQWDELDLDIIEELRYTFFLPSDYVIDRGNYILGLQEIVLNQTYNGTIETQVDTVGNYSFDIEDNGTAINATTTSTPTTIQFTTPTSFQATNNLTTSSSGDNMTSDATWVIPLDYEFNDTSGNITHNYTLAKFAYGCRYWSETDQKWSSDGCYVSAISNSKFSRCMCNHLTSFGSSFFVPPNTIDFKALSWSDLSDNYAVLLTVLILICVYLLLLYWAGLADKSDLIRLFLRGSVDKFLMSTRKSLGDIQFINIWHDNSGQGENKSWFLNQIEIKDLQTNEKFYFLCDRWLAVDEEDGKVERLLPVAGRDNLISFEHMFSTSTRKNLSENHLWFSVVSRPTRSGFSRVQRISCCFSLLFLTMITSAMFYKEDEEAEAMSTGKGIKLGPISLSFKEIWVGFVSVLIVSPVSIIIIQIFRKVEPPPGDVTLLSGLRDVRKLVRKNIREKRNRDNMILLELEDGELTQSEKGKPDKGRLRWYWAYVAYLLVALSILIPAAFVVMYSMQWKKEKSNRWLTSMFVSVFNSLLVTEPLKVVAVAFIMSLLFKKPTEEQDTDDGEEETLEQIKNIRGQLGGNKIPEREQEDSDDENENTLENSKITRALELQMQRVIKEIIGYILFMILLIAICQNNADPRKHYLHKSLTDLLIDSNYDGITESGSMFTWLDQTVLPSLYPQVWPNGKTLKWNEQLNIQTMSAIRVGPPRLRQLRIPPGLCDVPEITQRDVSECNIEYAMFDQEEGNFGLTWSNDSVFMSNESLLQTGGNPWAYRSAFDLGGSPITGKFATYSGGGYEAVLGKNLLEAQSVIQYLFENRWTDRYTRAVFLEFTLYNVHVNLFVYSIIVLEYPSASSVSPFYQINVFRMYDFQGNVFYVIFLMSAYAVYAIYLMYSCIMIYSALRSVGRMYLTAFWNLIDFAQTVLGLALVVMYFLRYGSTKMYVGNLSNNDRNEFVNFQYIAMLNEIYTLFMGLVLFLAIIKMLKLLRFNKRIGMLAATIAYASETLIPFSFMFLLVLINFASFGYLAFAPLMPEYESFGTSLTSLMLTFVGTTKKMDDEVDYKILLSKMDEVLNKVNMLMDKDSQQMVRNPLKDNVDDNQLETQNLSDINFSLREPTVIVDDDDDIPKRKRKIFT
uniref:Uncharacterized protein LOC100374130 n=1 Tax=Saccoglossus kowalevskii TaxID=10224 RepID=A0ABM0MHH0_SACKO|nr:PREDICTED: uncharacterized protein LOC100374130 [Saccoglossus kowalevskii]